MDKVTAITDILQHESKDLSLLGLGLDRFQSVFVVCEIKRVMHGFKEGLDIAVALILL